MVSKRIVVELAKIYYNKFSQEIDKRAAGQPAAGTSLRGNCRGKVVVTMEKRVKTTSLISRWMLVAGLTAAVVGITLAMEKPGAIAAVVLVVAGALVMISGAILMMLRWDYAARWAKEQLADSGYKLQKGDRASAEAKKFYLDCKKFKYPFVLLDIGGKWHIFWEDTVTGERFAVPPKMLCSLREKLMRATEEFAQGLREHVAAQEQDAAASTTIPEAEEGEHLWLVTPPPAL
jgi:hypothetical protein